MQNNESSTRYQNTTNKSLFSDESEIEVIKGILRYKRLANFAVELLTPDCFFNVERSLIFSEVTKFVFEESYIDNEIIRNNLNISIEDFKEHQGINAPDKDINIFEIKLNRLLTYKHKRSVRQLFNIINQEMESVKFNISDVVDNFNECIEPMLNLKSDYDERDICEKADEIADYLLNYNDTDERIKIDNFPRLNKTIGGLKRGSLNVIAGLSGYGKTSFAINIATSVARDNRCYFICAEMTYNSLVEKIFSDVSDTNLSDIRENNISLTKQKITDLMSDVNIFIDPVDYIEINQIISRIKFKHSIKKFDVIFLDYLTLFRDASVVNKDRDDLVVASITRKLKQLALNLNISIVLLAQFNATQKNDSPASMSNLKGSSEIAQNSDVIMLVDKQIPSEDKTKDMRIRVAKNRFGNTSTINFRFLGNKTKFLEYIKTNDGFVEPKIKGEM